MSEGDIQLRVYALLDNIQPQYAALCGTVARGDIPLQGMAQLYLEVAPGSSVLSLLDAALWAAEVRPGFQILEREFGQVELHGERIDAVREAGAAMLRAAGVTQSDRLRPQVVSDYLVSNVTPYQAQLINRDRHGSLLIPGSTMLVMEVEPAGYVALAANAAERDSEVTLINFDPVGRYGRLMMAGRHSDVEAAREAAVREITENAER